jgi:predicted nucleic acid-binding Zn ribbon protein
MANRQEDDDYLLDDYRRRRVPVRPAKKMADVMSQLLAKRGYAQVQSAAAFDEAWKQAAGKRFAADTRAGNVKRGLLEVTVRNTAVLQELTFLKAKLVKTLGQLVPECKIRDVKFRVGTFE